MRKRRQKQDHRRKSTIRPVPAIFTAIFLTCPVPLLAAETSPLHPVPAGDLADALRRLALDSGRNLLVISDEVRGRTTGGSREGAAIEDALTQILKGTGLGFRLLPNGAISVFPLADRHARADAPAPAEPPPGPLHEIQSLEIFADRFPDPAARFAWNETGPAVLLTPGDIARAPDGTVAEALARLPGIGVALTTLDHYLGGVDTAARGQGGFVSIRGMDSEYNVTLINGVNAAQSMPYSRQMSLSLMPPQGLSGIVVRKTSGADMDGDAIGGTIDFRTPTAFDSDRPFTRITTQGQIADRALDYHLDAGGGGVQVETSQRPGPAVGIYLTGYYDQRNFTTSELDWQSGDFGYRLSDGRGNSAQGLSPGSNLVLGAVNPQFTTGTIERYGGNASLDWRGDNNSAYWRGTYGYASTRQNIYQIGLQSRGLVSATPLPGGQVLHETTDAQLHYWFETNPELAELVTQTVGGTSRQGSVTADYSAFFSYGQNSKPDHIETSWGVENPSDNTTYIGALGTPLTLSWSGRYPVPALTAAQRAMIADPSSYRVHNQGELNSMESTQRKGGARFDVTVETNAGILDRVRFGGKYVASRRAISDRDWNVPLFARGQTLADVTLSGAPVITRTLPAVIPGRYSFPVPLLDGDRLLAAALARRPALSPDEENGNSMDGTETVAAGYAMAGLRIGALEILPGVRFESSTIGTRFWDAGAPDPLRHHWGTSHTAYDELLPSLFINARPTEDLLLRAGIWTSYARPAFFQLGGGTQTSVSPDGGVTIAEGNPHLRPVEATNFDLAAEWRGPKGGHLSVAGYLKQMSHYLYNSGDSYLTGTTTNLGSLSISRPENGGSARVLGVELAASQTAVWAPPPFDGLGIAGNITLQNSAAHLNDPLLGRTNPMQGTPGMLANLSLFLERDGLMACLSWRYSGAYVEQYGEWGSGYFGTAMNGSALNKWVHPSDSLDVTIRYRLSPSVEVSAAAANLLGGDAYYSTIGRTSGTVAQIINAGRVFRSGLIVTF